MPLYLDTSALVKLVVEEAESDDLRTFVGSREVVSSQLARTELIRAVARSRQRSVDAAEDLIAEVTLLALSRLITARAAWVKPLALRSLDAIHVASAATLEAELDALVTYDGRMVEAGRLSGLPVASPGAAVA